MMDIETETEFIFRRLDRQIINRAMARTAIKYLARSYADRDDCDALENNVDAIFDEHETTKKHPLLLAFRIKRLLDDHSKAVEQPESERRLLMR